MSSTEKPKTPTPPYLLGKVDVSKECDLGLGVGDLFWF